MRQWLQKIWEGDTVYEEPVSFLETSKDIKVGDLLYTPDRIVKVTTSDGSYVYEEGRDYTLDGKKLLRTKDSRLL